MAERAIALREAFQQSYPISFRQPEDGGLGVRNADTDARGFIFHAGLPSSEVKDVRRVYLRSVDSHLYDGVVEGLSSLVTEGDFIAVWTVGETHGIPEQNVPGFGAQYWKIAKSGIRYSIFGKEPREHLTQDERRRFSVWSTDFEKETLLPKILSNYESQGINHIVLVDDKSDNLLKARAEVIRAQAAGTYHGTVDIVWMNQGRSKDKLPKGYSGTLEDFKAEFRTVTSIGEYVDHVTELRNTYDSDKTVGHIFDWDHTLADETARKTEIENRLVTLYQNDERVGETSYLPHDDSRFGVICEMLGIPPSRALIEPLGGGISFVGVYRVNWNGLNAVVKHENNPERLWRLTDEIEGYKLIGTDGYIRRHMPEVFEITHHPQLGPTIVMEYFNGPNLRQAIKGNVLSQDELLYAADQVLTIQKDFWIHQKHVTDHEEWFSMPAAEWQETKRLLVQLVSSVSSRVGFREEELITMPIVAHLNGQEVALPSLATLVHSVDTFLKQRPQVVLSLGYNDLSHGNVVILGHGKNLQVKIVDPQWVRKNSDPAADLTRPLKSVSSTTVKVETTSQPVRVEDGVLHFFSSAVISPLLEEIEQRGEARIGEFAEVLGDETLPGRVRMHLAASHLREMALIERGRGAMDQIGFNLFRASKYLGVKRYV